MIRTYKYRLYPRRAQREVLSFLLEWARNLYNAALGHRMETYKNAGKGVSYPEQWNHFRDERCAHPETFGKLNATSVQQLLRRLDKAFKAFFRRLKAGEKPGFPRFKGKNRFRSLEYRYGDGCKLRMDATGRTVFYVQNVGEIKVKYHRPVPDDAQIKQAVLKQSFGKWYVCLTLETSESPSAPSFDALIGVDMGLKSLLAFSDGTIIENPRWLRTSLTKLRVAQRRLSRRKKGSHRRRKAAWQVAWIHEKIKNQRQDFWHKLTRKMVENCRLIALEDLSLAFMTQNRRLALSAHDAGLGMFQRLLEYKAEEADIQVVAVDPRNTSQMCSGCGELVSKSLKVRTHRCPKCGLVLDRDVNAARNILKLALPPLGRSGQAPTWTEVRSCVA